MIALDEDDVIAIATRELAENYPLFVGERLVDEKTKNISLPSLSNRHTALSFPDAFFSNSSLESAYKTNSTAFLLV